MMIKSLKKFVYISRKKVLNIIILNIIEAFFLISSIFLLFPLLRYLTDGKHASIELLQQKQYLFVYNTLNLFHIEINLLVLIILAFFPVLFSQTVRYIKNISIVTFQQDIINKVRKRFIEKLFNTKINVFKNVKVGELANAVGVEAQRIGLATQYELNIYSFSFISFIYFLILLNISLKLFIITGLLLSILPFILKTQNQSLKTLGQAQSIVNEKLQSFIIEKIKTLKFIYIKNIQNSEKENFLNISKEFESIYLKSGKSLALVEVLIEPLMFFIVLIVIFLGVEKYHFTFDKIVVFLYVLTKLNQSIKSVIMNKNQVNIYRGSLNLYKKYLSVLEQNQLQYQNNKKEFKSLKNSIKTKNLTFSFKNKKIFDNLNVEFFANNTTAIIGKSGSGKSTLIDLILGFYDYKGEILIDNVELNEIDLISFRKQVGYVSQESFLFFGTIKENLLYGLSDKSDEEIKQACKKAHILDFIESLENGLDTHIGEGGGKLSGGQKQRLQLAHLFLQDPEIIIMDEPTSALDSESERVILDTLKELHHKKTIIIIAHRLSTIQHADKIIVLEDGKVIEEGTHEELMDNKSRYKKYFEGNS